MEITKNETKIIHDSYDEYELSLLNANLLVGEKLTISINDVVVKEYTVKYSNALFNLNFQDKGVKINLKLLTESELIQKQIDKLEAEKVILETRK